MFQLPNKIVTGGLGGISIIINYYFNIDPSKIILIISLIILILGFFLLGKIKTTGAIIATFIYPTFLAVFLSRRRQAHMRMKSKGIGYQSKLIYCN
jgi:uncharacterized membrane-anchored protein YitT (DUF2179 family)